MYTKHFEFMSELPGHISCAPSKHLATSNDGWPRFTPNFLNPFFQFRLQQGQIVLGCDVLNQMLVNGDRHPFRGALIHPELVL